MKIDEIKLTNFRNYDQLNLKFSNNLNIIYGINGSIYIDFLPYLENIKKINLINENIYTEKELIFKYFKNENNNSDNLIVCDMIKQKVYIIGEC